MDVTAWAVPDPPVGPPAVADGDDVVFEPGEPLLLMSFFPSFPASDDASSGLPLEQAERTRREQAASAPKAATRGRRCMVKGPPSGRRFAGRTGRVRFTLHPPSSPRAKRLRDHWVIW
ncbi:hypothetical protein GCM10010376_83900 [Streptomyces violaceusniger]